MECREFTLGLSGFMQIHNLGLQVLWYFLHLLITLWYLKSGLSQVIESYLISSGLLGRYKTLNIGKLRYLAIVVESEDAYQISKVLQLLQWVEAIGVKHVCLYDSEGVLKKSKQSIIKNLENAILLEEAIEKDLPLDQNHMTLEFVSISDGKEAITRAANLLFMKYLKLANTGGADLEEQFFTEAHMDEALKALVSGHRGPEPDLLLVYGPVRCHLGFPAWRIRYTEIVHMGPLKFMSYGSLIKAIYKYTMVYQNYGT
ncbi:dehydrodolichyl diphosphate synthase complex subunit NUS1 isoform X2 [Jatropha curcas]|uniref:dehydrodolichyl diphosphate synthase complex subunit NUS1 isoform X2 n=1 Tax=Jatropha curcas TaxID=180498 RepID=UPI0005FAEFA3|nr:dehydrodolichyl diphosphate synthase complex subunit NUS1 isoform X2 [Jatropha curcas]